MTNGGSAFCGVAAGGQAAAAADAFDGGSGARRGAGCGLAPGVEGVPGRLRERSVRSFFAGRRDCDLKK